MATKGTPPGGFGNPANRGRGNSGYGVPDSFDVGYSTAQGESIVIAVALAICLMVLAGFVTLTGFLYSDLQSAKGANKMIEKKIQAVVERCDK